MERERHNDVRHMPDLVPRGFVLGVLLGALLLAVLLCVLAYLLLGARESALRPGRDFPEQRRGAPRQVSDVRAATFAVSARVPSLNEEERARLDGYAWVDRSAGVVRIPIKRAMEILMKEERTGAQP